MEYVEHIAYCVKYGERRLECGGYIEYIDGSVEDVNRSK